MKMEKVELAFYEFDARDVIVTSGEGMVIPSSLTFLVLSDKSVENFNSMHINGDPVLMEEYFSYAAYGLVNIYKDGFKYNRYGGLSDNYIPDREAFATDPIDGNIVETIVRANNREDYYAVLNWLITNTEYPH